MLDKIASDRKIGFMENLLKTGKPLFFGFGNSMAF
jgi:hypothetical protein